MTDDFPSDLGHEADDFEDPTADEAREPDTEFVPEPDPPRQDPTDPYDSDSLIADAPPGSLDDGEPLEGRGPDAPAEREPRPVPRAPGPRVDLSGEDDIDEARPAHSSDRARPTPDHTEEIRLDLDANERESVWESPQPEAAEPAVELPLDGEVPAPFDVPEGNALVDDAVVAAALVAVGAGSAVLAKVRAAAPTSPPLLASRLDDLGIDARVEHGDPAELRERIAAGHEVLVATDGTAGTSPDNVVRIESIDEDGGVLVTIDAAGGRGTVALDRFEEAWEDSANQMIVASGPASRVVLLPVTLDGGSSVAS